MITFSNPTFEEAISREWLVTNGIGGYAGSTICGANTRRYHGLLVAALQPPTGRQVLVSKVLESLQVEENNISLSSDRYPGVVHPEGFRHLSTFERDPLPKAVYEIDGYRLGKTVFMKYGENTSIVAYENLGDKEIQLQLTPLFVQRDYHSLFHEDPYFDYYYEALSVGKMKVFAHYGADPLYVRFTHGNFTAQPDWYRSFQYEKEDYRGLDFQEDTRRIGQIELSLAPGQQAFLICSTKAEAMEGNPETWKQEEIERLKAIPPAELAEPFVRDLAISGDQFLVERQSAGNHTIIAGYHWFTDWGRDTMIAMRGLAVALGKKELSESIIRTFLEYLDGGMIPNRFPDHGETPEYNTIDATLWLFVVLYEFHERFEDLGFVQELLPKLEEVIEAHLAGARYGIHVTEEGLLFGGEDLVQLTWMDAKVGDYVVTPRHGCPVEINVLWYNALEIYNFFYDKLSETESPYKNQATKAKTAFRQYFLNENGYLNDLVIPDNFVDAAIRPNQIYALSLPFSPLLKKESKTVLSIVEKQLYTGLGLRSLAADHPDFKATYGGNPWERDTAYHQGTVWAFLWGEYALAYLKYHKFSRKACKAIWEKSKPLQEHFYDSDCLYAISEIFDGGEPDSGRGCVQQAWSIGMLLRVFLDSRWKF
jgi:predicted glycogen debranching enzyme